MLKILTESKEVCKSGIYKITCLVNEKVYIGSAIDLDRRYSRHFSNLKNKKHDNLHLQNAWNKYGSENFTFDVIQYVPHVKRLIFWEQLYLDYYHAANRIHGFNICPKAGNCLGVKHTAETRVNQSKRMKGHLYNLGKKASPETRAKMSLAAKGRFLSKSHRLSLATSQVKNNLFYYVATSPDNVVYDPILNLTEFCKNHNLTRSAMCAVSNGRQKRHKKWLCQKVQKVELKNYSTF